MPYFNKEGEITKVEKITYHQLTKYMKLSNDNIDVYMHTPNKTLIYLIDMGELPKDITNFNDYINYYKHKKTFMVVEDEETYEFGNTVIYNDYEKFIEKITHLILSL